MGSLIAIEGIDGTGKGTQARLLTERMQASGLRAALLSFPRYDRTFFGSAVGDFLNGRFGALVEVHPFLVSLLFAGDRFESRALLLKALADHDVVVLDRYVASNVAHQGAKLEGSARETLCRSIERVEYDIFRMPRPDLVILLDLSVEEAQRLIGQKTARTYTERAADIQEADGDYLSRVRELYLALARNDPSWSVVGCDREGRVRPIEEIGEELWQLASKPLPPDLIRPRS